MSIRSLALIFMAWLSLEGIAFAADAPPQAGESPQLQTCLKQADDLPDIAAANADAWIKRGGGNDAHLCRAFAQANRGMHADAAREFWALASFYDKKDQDRAVMMHNLSGQEFLRAKDTKNAEAQYTSALKIMPQSTASLVGLAQTLMEFERYWDALSLLNRALKIQPDDIDALRQRGRAWIELGNEKNAEEDFDHAEALAGESK